MILNVKQFVKKTATTTTATSTTNETKHKREKGKSFKDMSH